MAPERGRQGYNRRRGGFTLVEVAIALAIFVFGSLAILRIFPPALAAIRSTSERTLGTRLARNLITQYNNLPRTIPAAIIATDPDHYWLSGTAMEPNWQDYNIAFFGTTSRNASLPLSQEDFTSSLPKSALNSFRMIIGERQTVQTSGSPARVFVRTNYPCRNPADSTASASDNEVRVYKEYGVSGVVAYRASTDSKIHLDFTSSTLSDGTSFASTTNPKFPKVVGTSARYYVTYRWSETQSGVTTIHTVLDEPMEFSSTVPVSPSVGYEGMIPLEQYRDGVGGTTVNISTGPVQVHVVELINRQNATSDNAAMVGYLDLGLKSSWDTSVTEVLLDYPSTGWSWLVYDDGLSTATPVQQLSASTSSPHLFDLTLPVKHLDDSGVPFYTQLTATNSSGKVNTCPSASAIAWGGNPVDPVTEFDSRTTTIKYDTTNVEAGGYSGTRVRTVYQTLDSWGEQPAVAAKTYIPYYANAEFASSTRPTTAPQQPWREYFWKHTDPDPNTLYFHASEAGKLVMVSYQYLDSSTPTPQVHNVQNQVVTIKDQIVPAPTWVPSTYAPSGFVASVNLVDSTMDLAGGKKPYGVVSILEVQGLSTAARSVFYDGKKFQQAVVTGYRSTSL